MFKGTKVSRDYNKYITIFANAYFFDIQESEKIK